MFYGNEYRVATLLEIVPNCYMNHYAKYEVVRTIITCLLTKRANRSRRTDRRTNPNSLWLKKDKNWQENSILRHKEIVNKKLFLFHGS